MVAAATAAAAMAGEGTAGQHGGDGGAGLRRTVACGVGDVFVVVAEDAAAERRKSGADAVAARACRRAKRRRRRWRSSFSRRGFENASTPEAGERPAARRGRRVFARRLERREEEPRVVEETLWDAHVSAEDGSGAAARRRRRPASAAAGTVPKPADGSPRSPRRRVPERIANRGRRLRRNSFFPRRRRRAAARKSRRRVGLPTATAGKEVFARCDPASIAAWRDVAELEGWRARARCGRRRNPGSSARGAAARARSLAAAAGGGDGGGRRRVASAAFQRRRAARGGRRRARPSRGGPEHVWRRIAFPAARAAARAGRRRGRGGDLRRPRRRAVLGRRGATVRRRTASRRGRRRSRRFRVESSVAPMRGTMDGWHHHRTTSSPGERSARSRPAVGVVAPQPAAEQFRRPGPQRRGTCWPRRSHRRLARRRDWRKLWFHGGDGDREDPNASPTAAQPAGSVAWPRWRAGDLPATPPRWLTAGRRHARR